MIAFKHSMNVYFLSSQSIYKICNGTNHNYLKTAHFSTLILNLVFFFSKLLYNYNIKSTKISVSNCGKVALNLPSTSKRGLIGFCRGEWLKTSLFCFFFFWLHQVTYGIFSSPSWNQSQAPALEAQRLNHWSSCRLTHNCIKESM